MSRPKKRQYDAGPSQEKTLVQVFKKIQKCREMNQQKRKKVR
jgi:hypothetical protein